MRSLEICSTRFAITEWLTRLGISGFFCGTLASILSEGLAARPSEGLRIVAALSASFGNRVDGYVKRQGDLDNKHTLGVA